MFAPSTPLSVKIGLAGLLAAACLGATGCADFSRVTKLAPTPPDPKSPVAEDVRAATRSDYAFPSFRNVPKAPEAVRPAGAFAADVAALGVEQDRLAAWIAANPSLLPAGAADTEAFAAAQRAMIPAGEQGLSPDPAGTEDFAARLRALAAPPPPPK